MASKKKQGDPTRKGAPAPESISIEYIPLEEIKKWPANPKRHDFDALGESIERFGFVQPLLLNEATGMLVAGHGRFEELSRRFDAGEPAPGRIKVLDDGQWAIPVIRGVSFANEAEAAAFALADNRLVELGGWNEVALAGVIKEIEAAGASFSGMGWDQGQIEALNAFAGMMSPNFPEPGAVNPGMPAEPAGKSSPKPAPQPGPGGEPAPEPAGPAQPPVPGTEPPGAYRIIIRCADEGEYKDACKKLGLEPGRVTYDYSDIV